MISFWYALEKNQGRPDMSTVHGPCRYTEYIKRRIPCLYIRYNSPRASFSSFPKFAWGSSNWKLNWIVICWSSTSKSTKISSSVNRAWMFDRNYFPFQLSLSTPVYACATWRTKSPIKSSSWVWSALPWVFCSKHWVRNKRPDHKFPILASGPWRLTVCILSPLLHTRTSTRELGETFWGTVVAPSCRFLQRSLLSPSLRRHSSADHRLKYENSSSILSPFIARPSSAHDAIASQILRYSIHGRSIYPSNGRFHLLTLPRELMTRLLASCTDTVVSISSRLLYSSFYS